MKHFIWIAIFSSVSASADTLFCDGTKMFNDRGVHIRNFLYSWDCTNALKNAVQANLFCYESDTLGDSKMINSDGKVVGEFLYPWDCRKALKEAR